MNLKKIKIMNKEILNSVECDPCDAIEALDSSCEDSDCNPVSDQEVIQGMNIPFKPIDERILVKPLKPIMLSVTHDVIDQDKMDDVKELDDNGVPTLQTKTITEDLESTMRIGVVLAVHEPKWSHTTNTAIPEYKVGNKIVYSNKSAMPFDLYKDSVLLRKYDVFGVWLNDIE
jgi:co-chaperonin GroES (HSP10)